MASAGNQICYANFNQGSIISGTWTGYQTSGTWADSYTFSTGTGGSDGVQRVIYISAPVFFLRNNLCTAWLRSAESNIACYYYNWNTGAWVKATDLSLSSWYDDYQTTYFAHNANGYTSSSDVANYHLWKLVFSTRSDVYNDNNYGNLTIYAGGMGCMTEAKYNSLAKGKLIVSAGNLSGSWIYSNSTADDSTALSKFRWSSDTGSLILATKSDKLIPKSWV